ncbi:MAG: hypothetical protein QXU91_00225 [Thermofilum sp.]
MRVLMLDEREGSLELVIEVPEDLYFLTMILDRGDHVYAWTTRQLRVGEAEEKGDRVRVYLGIAVEKISYSKFSSKIRLTGRIVDAPEVVGGRGSYHTLSLGVGDRVKVVKQKGIRAFTKEMISRARSAVKKVLLVSVGDEEIAAGFLSPVGLELRISKPVTYSKTGREESIREQLYPHLKELLESVLSEYSRERVDEILVATTERLASIVSEILSELSIRAKLIKVSEGGEAGVYEVVRREDLRGLFKGVRADVEREAIETVLRHVSLGSGRVLLSLDNVLEASRWGVVRELLLVDELLWDEKARDKAVEAFNNVLENSGKVLVIPSESESGLILKKLGGAAALLYYELPSSGLEKTST